MRDPLDASAWGATAAALSFISVDADKLCKSAVMESNRNNDGASR